MLKALQDISYKEIAEYIDLLPNSFYSWLNGQYEFSEEREKQLQDIVDILKEPQK